MQVPLVLLVLNACRLIGNPVTSSTVLALCTALVWNHLSEHVGGTQEAAVKGQRAPAAKHNSGNAVPEGSDTLGFEQVTGKK